MRHLFRKILCPIDFSEPSMAALECAIGLAIQNRASIYLLNVAPLPIESVRMLPPPPDAYPFREDEARANLEKVGRDSVDGRVPYTTIVVSGDAGTGILHTIRNLKTDLVVMGTHGRRGFDRLLLGSVSERVVRESPVPVLTVRRKVVPASQGSEVPK